MTAQAVCRHSPDHADSRRNTARPGVLAEVTTLFAKEKVSFASVIQKGEVGEIVDIVFLTHRAKEGSVQEALKKAVQLSCVEKISNLIRVVDI